MLKRLAAIARDLASDPFVLGMVGSLLLSRSFELIGAQLAAQAAGLRAGLEDAAQAAAEAGAASDLLNGGPVPSDQVVPEGAPAGVNHE